MLLCSAPWKYDTRRLGIRVLGLLECHLLWSRIVFSDLHFNVDCSPQHPGPITRCRPCRCHQITSTKALRLQDRLCFGEDGGYTCSVTKMAVSCPPAALRSYCLVQSFQVDEKRRKDRPGGRVHASQHLSVLQHRTEMQLKALLLNSTTLKFSTIIPMF